MKNFIAAVAITLSFGYGWIQGHYLNWDIACQQVVVWQESVLSDSTDQPHLKAYAEQRVVKAKAKLLWLEGKKLGIIR